MLGTAQVPAEPGDHLVEHEEGPVFVAQCPDTLEEAWPRLDRGGGLEDDAGDAAGMIEEQGGEAVQVVVPERDRERAARRPASRCAR